MRKTYVLDTNVLLHAPNAFQVFGDNKVVIPEVVLEELDKFKHESGELGANARLVGRMLDKLREKGKLHEGVYLENGGLLKVEMNHLTVPLPPSWDPKSPDNRIIQVCKGLAGEGEKVFLVTKDIFERIKADILEVEAQDYRNDHVPSYDDQYKGRQEVYVEGELLDRFYQDKTPIKEEEVRLIKEWGGVFTPRFVTNEFVLLRSSQNPKQSALGKFNGKEIVPLRYSGIRPFGIAPKSVGQKFLLEALLSPPHEAPLVIAKGAAGTGKTLLALAAGLHRQMGKDKWYRRILVLRPSITMDEQIGFLPGDEQAKIDPLMRPVRDNLEILIDNDEEMRYVNEKELADKVEELFERKIVTTEALGFMRGRSLVKMYVIVDEAQNLTPKQVKGLITRAGNGTKIVLLGDPEQSDHPFLDARSNGLCYASEKMKGSSLCYQVTLNDEECERSELAAEGARRL
ncbi:MAG: PhoH family protein [Peptococcaceae bacterium]|nr:PhoH family protein [Peptococcaceae bacterium]